MKVACLYYGQPRFTNNPYCFESHKKFIFDRYDTDIFAHLWWDNEEDYDRSHVSDWEFSSWLQMDKCPKDKDDYKRFLDKWNPLALSTSQPRQFENEQMWLEIEKRFDTERFHKKNFHNQLSQLFSIQKVGQLIGDRINDYDFVILIRSDINIWDYPDLNTLPRNKFYLSSHAMPFPDLGFIFPPRFKRILNTYEHCEKNLVNWDLCWAPVAEAFKYSCYKRFYSESDLLRGPLPLRLVRGVDCKGPTW